MYRTLLLNGINHLFNSFISLVTLIIAFNLVAATQWLINYQPDYEYSRMYFSILLPVELLCILLPILVLVKDLNFNLIVSKTAISLLLFNCYSFYVLSNYYPLFALDGSEYSNLYGLIYQIFLSLSNYITVLYGFYFIIYRIFKVFKKPHLLILN